MGRINLLLPLVLAASCGLPEIDVPDDRALSRADYPDLRPLSQLLERSAGQPARIGEGTPDALRARARALRARAALLRQSALGDAERERLRAALARLRDAG